MRPNERTYLTRPVSSPDYVEFASLLRTRRTRIRQFQCCICATLIVVFVMTLVVTVSYSVNHAGDEVNDTNNKGNLTSSKPSLKRVALKMAWTPYINSDSGRFVNNASFGSFFVADEELDKRQTPHINAAERDLCLKAGVTAMTKWLEKDAEALKTPLPSPSPDSRHRKAVSTNPRVRDLALAAVAEIAATKEIESSRSSAGKPSSMGSYFDGGWVPRNSCKEFIVENCTIGKYRTYDGSCNRPMNWGASMTPFRRTLQPDYRDGIDLPRKAKSGRDLPSAREISLRVHPPSPSTNPSFTVMLAVFGQFLDHDITATAISQGPNDTSISCCPPAIGHPECFPVEVASGDPAYDIASKTCMEFVRSAPAPQCKLAPREQLNQVSAFIDGSTIYGPDEDVARRLREGRGGRLEMQTTPDNRTLLPPSMDPNDGCNRNEERLRGRYCFAAGDARANENLHLTTMHLLWARQHNKIAEQLSQVNPSWDDETVYQETRRVIGAQLQHITYQEFLPIVLGEKHTSSRGLKPLTFGYRRWNESADDQVNNPAIANNFAAAAFRFAHTLLPGLMRMTDAQKGTYSYVELHKLLFNPYSLYAEGGLDKSITSATNTVVQKMSTHVTSQLTRYLFEDPTKDFVVPCGLDLVSLNIQRGRDHGIPGYTKWREHCGLGKTRNFTDLQGDLDPQALKEISMIYESVDDVDLYTGALAEIPKAGGVVGPTFTCLITDQFERLQKGDRYWYEVPDEPHSFTEDQLQELRKTSLAAIICDCADSVTQVQAEVMRTVTMENPMVPCEDIPRPSMQYWKENNEISQKFDEVVLPMNWSDFKIEINNTVLEIINVLESLKKNETIQGIDCAAVVNYIRESFSDLKNQLADLRPRNSIKNSEQTDSLDNLTIVTNFSEFQDWNTFKNQVEQLLDNSVKNISGTLPTTDEWTDFQQWIKEQFLDLKNEIVSMKKDIMPKKLPSDGDNNDTLPKSSLMNPQKGMFDWKSFKRDTLHSIDNAIAEIVNETTDVTYDNCTSNLSNISDNRPVKGKEWKNSTIGSSEDRKCFKDKIREEILPSENSAWEEFRNRITAQFAEFISEFSTTERNLKSSHGDLPDNFENYLSYLQSSKDKAKYTNFHADGKLLGQLVYEWAKFKKKMNNSLHRVINNRKLRTGVPMNTDFSVLRDATATEFAKLTDEIIAIKCEWITKKNKIQRNDTETRDMYKNKTLINPEGRSMDSKNMYTEFGDFKVVIYDTAMNFIRNINGTCKGNLTDLRVVFIDSFSELKTELAALRNVISNNTFPEAMRLRDPKFSKFDFDWTIFHREVNKTVADLVENLDNQKNRTLVQLINLLMEARKNFSDLELVTVKNRVQSTGWSSFYAKLNRTVANVLMKVSDAKFVSQDYSSSSMKIPGAPYLLLVLFILQFFVTRNLK